jgi:hypothetical protein
MTIGIAAIAKRSYIVTASDRALSAEIVSDNCIFKAEPLHKEWSAMLSGGDITDVVPIMENARERFSKLENTLDSAMNSLTGSFSERLSKKAESKALGRYSITMQEFLKKGKSYFNSSEYSAIIQEIKYERLDCTFLASGFDVFGKPHIFKVVEPGVAESYDKPGFWAIGSGETAARTLLLYLGQNEESSLEETIYNVCAAKFFSERAAGVGKETWFFIKESGSDGLVSPMFFLDEIRKGWENEGKPRIPQNTVKQLGAWLVEKRLVTITASKRGAELLEKLL